MNLTSEPLKEQFQSNSNQRYPTMDAVGIEVKLIDSPGNESIVQFKHDIEQNEEMKHIKLNPLLDKLP